MKLNMDREFINGRVRLIECDGLKYPTYESVEMAIKYGQANISPWIENLVPTAGKVAVIRRLVNAAVNANEGMITYGSVGTGTTAPALTDIKLVTEYFRKILAVKSYLSNVATFRMFLATSEGNTTLTEYGLFGEAASGTVDSGTLFERVLISRTKTSAKTLTIESKITVA